jgi:molybdopterin synthase catalytic subunit
VLQAPAGTDWVGLSSQPLPLSEATSWATTPGAGAVVCFFGVVRDHAEGRDDVVGLTYEAYEEAFERVLREVIAEARRRWPALERVALLHRVGRLDVSEPSVVVVVSSPHRGEAFEGARYCIDTLKETAPIWKREHWSDGDDWALGARPVRAVAE